MMNNTNTTNATINTNIFDEWKKTRPTDLNERLAEVIKDMEDSDLIAMWNEYCMTDGDPDNMIYSDDEFMDLMEMSQESPVYWLNRFFFGNDEGREETSANPNRNYFTFNGYGNVISFDYLYNKFSEEYYFMDTESLIDAIVSNRKDYENEEIAEVLAEFDEETGE